MKKNLKFLFIIMMAGLFGILMNFNVFAAQKGTVTATIERFVLGGDYIVAPTIVEFTPGETYETIFKRIAKQYNVEYDAGDTNWGFYLQGIKTVDGKSVDCGKDHIPSGTRYILGKIGQTLKENESDGLYEFSYTQSSGWMYYVNNQYVDGMSVVKAKDGDVVRFMFTLAYGADLTGVLNGGMTEDGKDKEYFKVGDKTELVRILGQANRKEVLDYYKDDTEFKDAYQDANEVMADIAAKQYDINDVTSYLEEFIPAPQKVTLNKETLSLKEGETSNLTYQITPVYAISKNATWASSDSSIVTVEDGVVTAKKAGTAKISVKTYNGVEAACDVTVTKVETPTPTPTPKPITVKATTLSKINATSYNQLKLTWTKVKDATGYEVFRSTSAKSGFKKVKSITKNTTVTYTNGSLATGKIYYYKVRAYKKVGTKTYYSSYSNVKNGKTKLSATKLTGKAGKKQATLTWKKVSGANGYELVRATSKTGKFKKVTSTTKTSYKNKSLSKKTYYYKVRAYRMVSGKKVYSTYSSVVKVKIK